MAELSDDVKAPENVTYERVLGLTEQIRESMVEQKTAEITNRPVQMVRSFCAENGDFRKFYTNFTKNLVTFGVLLRLLIIEAGVQSRPYKVVLEK